MYIMFSLSPFYISKAATLMDQVHLLMSYLLLIDKKAWDQLFSIELLLACISYHISKCFIIFLQYSQIRL